MGNLHGVHRMVAIQINSSNAATSNAFTTPLLDFSDSDDAEVSTIMTQGIDRVVGTQSHSEISNIRMVVIFNEAIMQLISQIRGNPNPSSSYTATGTITTSSNIKKIENFLKNVKFDYTKTVDIYVVTSENPIDFETPQNLLQILNGGISEVKIFKNCSIKTTNNASSATDYIKVSIEAMTGFTETHSKIGV